MNPNGLVPTLEEEDGFMLWESNSIVRYLAAKHQSRARAGRPARRARSRSKWMDWQLSVVGPAITPVFWGLIRTPPEKRDHGGDRRRQGEDHRGDEDPRRAARQDRVRRRRRVLHGDIPVGVMAYRYRDLVPDRPALPNLERWYAAIAARRRSRSTWSAFPLV